ncbi:MAG: EamA family transporter [Proteobacteria bacterium]|nr:MAG: EamA family transporter [Pseudomonadota bacterium]
MPQLSRQGKAYAFGIAAVLCWSTVATAFKLSLQYLSPAQLLLYASLSSWLFLAAILLAKGRLKSAFSASWSDYKYALFFGAMNPFIYYLVLFQAYKLLPAQEAQILNYSWALTLTLLAIPLLGHKLKLYEGIAALVCYSGVLVIATRGDVLGLEFSNLEGVAWALASTVLWALYWLLNTRQKGDALTTLFLNFSCALPMIFVYCAVAGELIAVPWQGLAGAIYVGLFEMGLSFIFWLTAMRLTNSTASIANLIFISPILSLMIINVLLEEPILPSTLIGLVLILGGLLIQKLNTPPKPQ